MKFQLLFEFVNFLHTILRTSKSIRNNTMKKMLLATALALLITGCAQQTFTVQNKPAAVAPKPSPSFLRFWNWAKKTVDAAKFWRRRKC